MAYKIINLTRGYKAYVDEEDYAEINQHKWHAKNDYRCVYAQRNATVNEKKHGCPSVILMHRQITGFPKDKVIDHKNHNGLDNRKQNLRVCTFKQNSINQRLQENKSINYKGVCWDKSKNKFKAYFCHNGKPKHIGHFYTATEAAEAYNLKTYEVYGEYANLNIID